MLGQVLHRFVQISDLHIGPIDPLGSGSCAMSLAQAKAYVAFPYADGLLGHQGQSLRDLASFFRKLKRTDTAPLGVLVTGDFTRCGEQAEVDLARDFLGATINLGTALAPVQVGLRWQGIQHGVPGNHDHWGGVNSPLSGASSIYYGAPYAAPLPRIVPVASQGPKQLVFIEVDSDSDVYPLGVERLLAQGRFESQLYQLDKQLLNPTPDEVRVMLIHHSMGTAGTFLRMNHSSKALLESFVQQHQIKVMLTGHTHAHTVVAHPLANGVPLLEVCCGSTSQFDRVPRGLTNLLGRVPKTNWRPNTLVLHELSVDQDGGTEWSAEPWYRDRAKNEFYPSRLIARYRV